MFFPKIALFHINFYLIGKVSPMYGFLADFSSPESIFAEKKNTYHLFCNQNRKYLENFDLKKCLKMLLTTKTRVVTISCNTCSDVVAKNTES